MSLKTTFPDEATLRSHLSAHIATYTKEARDAVGHLEVAYLAHKRALKVSIYLLIFGLTLFPITGAISGSILGIKLGAIATLIIHGVLVYTGGRMLWKAYVNTIKYEFETGLNKVLFSAIFSALDIQATLVEKTMRKDLAQRKSDKSLKGRSKAYILSEENAHVIDMLDASELITEAHNRLDVDNIVTITKGVHTSTIAEMDVRHVTGSGKHRHTKRIFHGYFVAIPLDIALTGKTFVSTEGDERGIGYNTLWGNSFNKNLGVTELEWNEFENMLHVMTTDPVEARYVLPPDFMLDLYAWWKERKERIRLSFIGNHLYILFANHTVRLNDTIASISEKEILAYMESIAIPLLHILHLTEDTERQFQHKK